MLQLDLVAKGYLSEIFVSFQGEGLYVGRRHLFLRLAGCHLRCAYCDTPGSLERGTTCVVHDHTGVSRQVDNPLSPTEAMAHALPILEAAGGLDGVAVTGGEPLLQADFLAELLADARWPRPRLLETSGTLLDKLTAVLPVVDVVSMDIKLPSNTGEAAYWETHERFLAAAGDKAYVKILLDNDTAEDELVRAAKLVRRAARSAPVFLQPITTSSGRIDLQPANLQRFFLAARRHVEDIRVLPQTHKFMGVQ